MHVLPPMKMEIVTENVQFSAPSEMQLAVQMKTLLPETGEEVIFEDCTNIDFDVQLSDEINFEVTRKASELIMAGSGHENNFLFCSSIIDSIMGPGDTTKKWLVPIRAFTSKGRNAIPARIISSRWRKFSLNICPVAEAIRPKMTIRPLDEQAP